MADLTYRLKTPGKPRVDLLPPRAMLAVADVLGGGASRDDGAVPGYRHATAADLAEYRAAVGRHLFAYYSGQLADADSGCHPLAHVIADAAILLELDIAAARDAAPGCRRNPKAP